MRWENYFAKRSSKSSQKSPRSLKNPKSPLLLAHSLLSPKWKRSGAGGLTLKNRNRAKPDVVCGIDDGRGPISFLLIKTRVLLDRGIDIGQRPMSFPFSQAGPARCCFCSSDESSSVFLE